METPYRWRRPTPGDALPPFKDALPSLEAHKRPWSHPLSGNTYRWRRPTALSNFPTNPWRYIPPLEAMFPTDVDNDVKLDYRQMVVHA